MHIVPVESIIVPENRQRKSLNAANLSLLADSIADKGLLHPIVCRFAPQYDFDEDIFIGPVAVVRTDDRMQQTLVRNRVGEEREARCVKALALAVFRHDD